jgi:hypothetical protein
LSGRATTGSGGCSVAFAAGLTPGSQVATFLKAPLRSRTVGFPESGSGLGSARHFSGRAFPHGAKLRCWRTLRPDAVEFASPLRHDAGPAVPSSESGCEPALVATECPEPLCPERALPAPGRPRKPPGGALPPRRRSYGLMRQTIPSPRLRYTRCAQGLCRLPPAPAGRWPFPTLSLRPLCRCSDLYPAALLGCACPFLHRGHRPHPTGNGFGARIYPHMAASVGSRISWLQSFDHLRAPALARPPDCSDRSARALGRRAFHTTHRPAGYPDRDVASLHVRHGQLTWLDSHQLGRSLVGCSLPHTAHRHRSPAGIQRPARARPVGSWRDDGSTEVDQSQSVR